LSIYSELAWLPKVNAQFGADLKKLSGTEESVGKDLQRLATHALDLNGLIKLAKAAARLRTEQLRTQLGPDTKITWLVYRQGYEDRAKQEHQDLISLIGTVRDKLNINLVWFGPGQEVINYLNNGQPRDQLKVTGFEYFGHSNRACFMFDYSNNIESACKSWLHDNDLTKINRRVFERHAYVKSWGCHTGEEMSRKWYAATGTRMIGAIGKTQFMMEELPILTSDDGRWVN